MKYTTLWQDLAFEAEFARPLYAMTTSNAKLIAALHEGLGRFQIPLRDYAAGSGTSLADVAARVRAFNGRGELYVSIDRYTATFKGLQSETDFTIVLDFTAVVESVLTTLGTPEQPIRFRMRTLRSTGHLKFSGKESTRDFLDSFVSPKARIQPTMLGTGVIDYITGFSAREQDGAWDARLQFERSLIEEANLYFSGLITFNEAEQPATLASRYEVASNLLQRAFVAYGLEPGDPSEH